jgi:serine/tyrosine/threonine adenylyltransferase
MNVLFSVGQPLDERCPAQSDSRQGQNATTRPFCEANASCAEELRYDQTFRLCRNDLKNSDESPTLKAGLPCSGWNFDNSYARLPKSFFVRLRPIPVRAPKMVLFNKALADVLGLCDTLDGEEGASIFSGNSLPEGVEPIAQAYAGHQFGHFTMLGDGRAILLGEHITPDGKRFDIQLKGSGQTPFSRRGDGRAALGPMLREYIISEALHALGVPTTRSLAVVLTGEPVYRETEHAGAILTRVAASHIRVGTFEFLAAQRNPEDLRILADYTLVRHYPEVSAAENPYLGLLRAVMERQALLVAKWLHIGFIHGVMNTDNMTLCGETIDYGPCAFMDAYDPATVFSSIDHEGRYAYGNQPSMTQWNLARLAETLLPLLHADQKQAIRLAQEAISTFSKMFHGYWLNGMRAKLGLFNEEPGDESLVEQLLACMQENQADFTNTFRDLARQPLPDEPVFRGAAFVEWHEQWRHRLARQPETAADVRRLMHASNPAVIPRNHRVEEALAAAVEHGNHAVLERLLEVLAKPYHDSPQHAESRAPPASSQRPYQTFCGT